MLGFLYACCSCGSVLFNKTKKDNRILEYCSGCKQLAEYEIVTIMNMSIQDIKE